MADIHGPSEGRTGHKRTVPPRGGLVRRRRILIGVVAGTLTLTGVGAWAATVLRSPAQVAAETAPPPADVLTAPVEKKVLSASLVTRGKVAASQRVDVLSAGLSGPDTIRAVVTKVKVRPGDAVKPGTALVEVAGRPVLALSGALPAYRNLTGGAVGQDVVQLQKALSAIGYSRGTDPSGTFGPGTQQAVKSLYAAAGYTAPSSANTKTDGSGKAGGEKSGDPQNSGAKAEGPMGKPSGTPSTVVLPASEIAFIADGPVRVESVEAVVGATAAEKLMTISAGELVIDGALESFQKDLVRPGQKVDILSDRTGGQAVGTVALVGPAPAPVGKEATAVDAAPRYQVKITPDAPLAAEFAGQDVRLTIRAASTAGEVLAVPTAAVSSQADGRTTISVISKSGKQNRIEVRTGMSGDGKVEITPVSGTLSPGDRVVLGVGRAPSVGGSQP
ncbi:peptidoglycan-binding protein [Streptomyces sp. NBC_01006]|uniref:peptidoglycan-binding protein n=1 Tax=Streptomyces sp. NBC_01006 TaxID=2903716 RepID=UPI002F9197FA|nr:peptidoglycan-binding protein [Streptomyces sp. NBC_01006]